MNMKIQKLRYTLENDAFLRKPKEANDFFLLLLIESKLPPVFWQIVTQSDFFLACVALAVYVKIPLYIMNVEWATRKNLLNI